MRWKRRIRPLTLPAPIRLIAVGETGAVEEFLEVFVEFGEIEDVMVITH